MNNILASKFYNKEEKKPVLPIDNTPISTAEKLAREEIKKLSENENEIKKLKEQIERLSETS